jgi:hypothetical protein
MPGPRRRVRDFRGDPHPQGCTNGLSENETVLGFEPPTEENGEIESPKTLRVTIETSLLVNIN